MIARVKELENEKERTTYLAENSRSLARREIRVVTVIYGNRDYKIIERQEDLDRSSRFFPPTRTERAGERARVFLLINREP